MPEDPVTGALVEEGSLDDGKALELEYASASNSSRRPKMYRTKPSQPAAARWCASRSQRAAQEQITVARNGSSVGAPGVSNVVTKSPVFWPARPRVVMMAGPVLPLKPPRPTVPFQAQLLMLRLNRTS